MPTVGCDAWLATLGCNGEAEFQEEANLDGSDTSGKSSSEPALRCSGEPIKHLFSDEFAFGSDKVLVGELDEGMTQRLSLRPIAPHFWSGPVRPLIFARRSFKVAR